MLGVVGALVPAAAARGTVPVDASAPGNATSTTTASELPEVRMDIATVDELPRAGPDPSGLLAVAATLVFLAGAVTAARIRSRRTT
jgi:hypothetical protein